MDNITSCHITIDTTKLDQANRGDQIAKILRDLAVKFEGNEHFKAENLINDVWGVAPLEFEGNTIGILEIT